MTTQISCEILDYSAGGVPVWTELVPATPGADGLAHAETTNVGPGTRGNKPQPSTAKITLVNKGQTMGATVSGIATTALEVQGRIRIKTCGPSSGNCLRMIHSGLAGAINASQAVSDNAVALDVYVLSFKARAQFDSCYNVVKATLTSSGGDTNATRFTFTNRWATYTVTLILTASSTTITPSFTPMTPGNGTNTSCIEYKDISIKKNGGANLLANGFTTPSTSTTTSPWSVSVVAGASLALSVVPDWEIRFNGDIDAINVAPHQRAGTLTTLIEAMGFEDRLALTTIAPPLQKNQTMTQLATTLMNQYDFGLPANILLDTPNRYYRFNDVTGATALDAGIDGQNGTYTGGFTLNQTSPLAGDNTGAGVSLNGSTGYVSVPVINLVNTSFSVEAFLYLTAYPGVGTGATIFNAWGANVTDQNFALYVANNGALVGSLGSDDISTAASAIALNTGYYIVFVYDYPSLTSKLYINGALNTSGTPKGPINLVATKCSWGAEWSGAAYNWFWTGNIAEGAVYLSSLSAADVARHYQAAQGYFNVLRIPGKQIDPDPQVFQRAFIDYVQHKTFLIDGLNDTALSGYGRHFFDLDGTFRFVARDDVPRRIVPSAAAAQTPASTTLYLGTNPADGDTVLVGTTLYTYKTTLGTAPNQVLIGARTDDTAANLVAAVTGGAGSGTKYTANTVQPYGMTASFNPALPTRATMWHDQATVVSGSPEVTAVVGADPYAFVALQPAANGDTTTNSCFVQAGTYYFNILGSADIDRGIVDWYVDNIIVLTGQDWYSAAAQVVKVATITLVGDGYHVFKSIVNGKNSSSSSYKLALTKYWIEKVND